MAGFYSVQYTHIEQHSNILPSAALRTGQNVGMFISSAGNCEMSRGG